MPNIPTARERDERASSPATLPRVTVAAGGRYVALHIPGPPPLIALQTKRGPIKNFSRGSRKRLLDRLQQIDRTRVRKLPLFITLTYPAEWPDDMKTCKRHLDTFLKRMKRSHKDAAIVWKMEYQKRGAPHFHMLVWNVPFIRHNEVARDWWETVGSGLKEHLAAGTEIKRVRSWGGVSYYAAKYLAKVEEGQENETPGRFWGIVGRALLPVGLLVRVVAWGAAYRVRRALWAAARRHGYRPKRKGPGIGVTAYVDWSVGIALLNIG